MTILPPTEFALSFVREPAALTVRVSGELDYDTSDDLVETVVEHLTAEQSPPLDVRLDFGDLTWIDSSGLSALLMVHRRTSALGATLHLDNRPEFLERMLRITNVLGHLTGPAHGGEPGHPGPYDGITGASAT
ncbi:STAS domain-containing protein [Streptomyces chromofuscus]|uniref:STAS domain-containing protein n=1 Tax=Streptomyces chromofuscus TaxID=42881 RepID=UPI001676187F|nr:STAS domain-containing protein [Streptomyces chromofuscus]GGT15650.1 sulfate transporter [Streptomyces chromofuscus]